MYKRVFEIKDRFVEMMMLIQKMFFYSLVRTLVHKHPCLLHLQFTSAFLGEHLKESSVRL